MFSLTKPKHNVSNFININKLSEGLFFDVKNFKYFIKKYNLNFYFIDYKKIFYSLTKVLRILQRVNSTGGQILFIGLHPGDTRFYNSFNRSLKNLAKKNGHLYADFVRNGVVYDHFSFFKRNTFNDGGITKGLPSLIFTFSRRSHSDVFKEFSYAGIPSFFFISDSVGSSNSFKDYPLFGIYSKKMLSFYLDFVNYSFNSYKKNDEKNH